MKVFITYDPTRATKKWWAHDRSPVRWFVRMGALCISVKWSP